MEFVKFKRAVHAQFNQLAAGADMLFLTNVDKDALWDCYLNSFPEEERQSHNCNNCKHYIRHYGRVVAIKDNKVVTMWENLQLDEPYATVARNLDALVKSSEKKAKRQKILDLMAKKQDAELEGKSLEELAKELEALN